MTKLEARKIEAHEVETYRRIGGYGYGVWSDELDEWNPDEAERNNMLAIFTDGTMTAKLVSHSYEQVVRGVWQPAGAIGGVASLPEYRRQGHVRALMEATFADMSEKQLAVSALYPFDQLFYAKFGYVKTNPIPRVKFECAALSHLVPIANQAGTEWRYERMPAIQSGSSFQKVAHRIAQMDGRSDYHGFMRDPARTADDWKNQHIVFIKEMAADQSEQIVAAARYELKGYGDGTTNIHETHWSDSFARDRLLAFFALHGAGMPNVQMSVSPAVNFHSWLGESRQSYDVHLSHLPLMVRVMDVEQVLGGVRIGASPANQSLVIHVDDALCPWVSGAFALVETEGVLQAWRTDEESTIQMTIEGITALTYGTLPVREVAYRGWISEANEEEITLLERWFPVQSVFNLLGF